MRTSAESATAAVPFLQWNRLRRPSWCSEVLFPRPFPEYLRPQHGCKLFLYIYILPVVAVVMLPPLCFVQADGFVFRWKPFFFFFTRLSVVPLRTARLQRRVWYLIMKVSFSGGAAVNLPSVGVSRVLLTPYLPKVSVPHRVSDTLPF